jgi:UDP-glucose 4-epimerase
MNCLVTGAAGFIGSHLCQRLLKEGNTVIGIDNFSDYYPKWIKETNLKDLLKSSDFEFIETDLAQTDLSPSLDRTEYVFHLAAQAGVRASWGKSFTVYSKNNIEATQKLLESVKETKVKRFIYASSSSVYGDCPDLPWTETSPLFPYSPYGVTKLAAEHLCTLYNRNYELPALSLRYFTVYGPGQRPDMAFHRFLKALKKNEPIPVFGDGTQTRDFTYIDDIIEATVASITYGRTGETYNIGGGDRKKLKDIFPILENICQKEVVIDRQDTQKGDAPHTYASTDKARKELKYSPQTQIEDGLREEWKWLCSLYSS